MVSTTLPDAIKNAEFILRFWNAHNTYLTSQYQGVKEAFVHHIWATGQVEGLEVGNNKNGQPCLVESSHTNDVVEDGLNTCGSWEYTELSMAMYTPVWL